VIWDEAEGREKRHAFAICYSTTCHEKQGFKDKVYSGYGRHLAAEFATPEDLLTSEVMFTSEVMLAAVKGF
jgi:hypothetical protein